MEKTLELHEYHVGRAKSGVAWLPFAVHTFNVSQLGYQRILIIFQNDSCCCSISEN